MSATFSILLKRLPELANPAALFARLCRVMDRENLFTVSHIQKEYLSFSKAGPTTLRGLRAVSTPGYRGTLFASKAAVTGNGIVSGIGSPMKNRGVSYPAVHEFGADIPAHDIVARNKKALRFVTAKGKVLVRKRVHIPAIHLPAREPIQRGLRDRLKFYNDGFNQAIADMLKN